MSIGKGETNIRVDWQMTIGFNTARCFVLIHSLIYTQRKLHIKSISLHQSQAVAADHWADPTQNLTEYRMS